MDEAGEMFEAETRYGQASVVCISLAFLIWICLRFARKKGDGASCFRDTAPFVWRFMASPAGFHILRCAQNQRPRACALGPSAYERANGKFA